MSQFCFFSHGIQQLSRLGHLSETLSNFVCIYSKELLFPKIL